VQTPYGDSGQTTFFIADEGDWKGHEKQIVGEQIKVMKRIEPRELAIEGVITRHGTLVGPLMAELTGFPELTPYDGGWCGNDVSPELLTEKQRRTARERTIAMGERLRKEGYRGYFELDYLLDADTGEAPGPAVAAARTLTLGAAKPGLLAPAARRSVGELRVLDIGYPPELLNEVLGA